MRNERVSIKDIAKKVGVSIATVSYVLSKDKESRVSVQMAEKIKKVAKELNYQPNQIAKSLKSGKTFTIGLIVADISNPFFANIARIVEDEATKRNYTVIFGSSDERADKSLDLIRFLSTRQVDGFIIVPTEGSATQIEHLKKQQIPFVLIDRFFPDISTNYVVIDNFKASYTAVDRLIKTGNINIGMIAYSNALHHMQERIRGYQTAMADQGVEMHKKWLKFINFSHIKEEIEHAIDALLSGKNAVNAIFFATNTLAVYGLKYIDTLNYKVPEDIAIVSFDEGEAFDFYYCPLTHIKQPIKDIGKKAVEVLIDQISTQDNKTTQICLDATLIIRKSCGTK